MVKRRRPAPTPAADSDEEIHSDSSVSAPPSPSARDDFFASASDSASDSQPPSSPTPHESAADRRLRLAKKVLRDVGLDPDASPASDASSSSSSADGATTRRDRQRLLDSALVSRGRKQKLLAAALAPHLPPSSPARRGHKLAATAVALSADEALAVTASKDRSLTLWDTETHRPVLHLPPTSAPSRKQAAVAGNEPGTHLGAVHAVALSHDAAVIASAGVDRVVRLWDRREDPAAARPVAAMKGHRGPVNALAFRRETMELFSASDDRTLKLWDARERTYVETLFGHGAEITAVGALRRERALSGARDGSVRLWKVLEGSQLVFRAPHLCVDAVAMVTDSIFVSGGDDGSLAAWTVTKKKPTMVVPDAHGQSSWISALAASPYSDLVVSGASTGELKFWRCGTGKDQGTVQLEHLAAVKVPGFVNGLALGSRGRVVAAAVGQEHRLGRWFEKAKTCNGLACIALPSVD